MGCLDDDSGFHFIATSELGLPQASVEDDTQATALLGEWFSGRLELGVPEELLVRTIDLSIQGILRRDVLEFYMAEPDGTYDEDPSSYGAEGPLVVQLVDGRLVLVDGNHRWATARILGKELFSAQVLSPRGRP